MITNILRILFERILFRFMNKELEVYNASRNDIPVSEAEQCKRGFLIRPIMAETYEGLLFTSRKMFVVIAACVTIFTVGSAFYLWFFDNTVYYPAELKTEKMLRFAGGAVLILLVLWMLPLFLKLMYRYMKETNYIFTEEKIFIRRFGKKEKVIDYKELRQSIVKRKIRVRKGRYEFPYVGGTIPVYPWGDKVPPPEFYQLINQKCGMNIPCFTETDAKAVRKTGIGWTMGSFLGIPFICMIIVIGFIGCIFDFGLSFNAEFWREYSKLFNPLFIGIFGGEFVVIGFVLRVWFYFSARRHFAKNRDIIKVLF